MFSRCCNGSEARPGRGDKRIQVFNIRLNGELHVRFAAGLIAKAPLDLKIG